ncbi:hypothetical protein MKX03_035424 [Papaver bracteatum]|nr:hypothetical protein MKX03_035424 [Papaver bracteatum]
MGELSNDLEWFSMLEEEAVQTNNGAEILGIEDYVDHMIPTGRICCFSNDTYCHDHLEETDRYINQYSDLHFPDNQSNELLHPDNFLLDVFDYLQESDSNCLLDQRIHNNETTLPLQQQSADNNCHEPQPSPSLLPVIPHNDELLIYHSHSTSEQQPLPQVQELPPELLKLVGEPAVKQKKGRKKGKQVLTSEQHQLLPQVQEPQERPPELLKLVGEPAVKQKKGRKKGKQVLTSEQHQLLPRVQEPQERPPELLKLVGEPVVKQKKGKKKGKQVLIVNHGEEEDDALGVAIDDDDDITIGESSSFQCRNLVSERNRRKRLNDKLLTLRGMVPNITKMDKRTVLFDALNYLQDILHQTKIEEEKQNNISRSTADHLPRQHLGVVSDKSLVNINVEGLPQTIMSSTVLEPSLIAPSDAIVPAITEMEAEKVDEERYLLKIVYNKALGSMAKVQRSVEMLKGIEFINVSISEYDQHHMQSTSFLLVKKIKGSVLVTDAENLLERFKTTAKQLGLQLPCASISAED